MARQIKPIAIMLFTAALTSLSGCGEKTPEERIKAAQQLIHDAKHKDATIELKTALQSNPNDLEARMLLGLALENLELWADSEKELSKALELGAQPEQALPRLAHVLVKQGKFENVLALKIPSVGLQSQSFASMQAERANAYLGLGKPDDADTAISEGEKALSNISEGELSLDLLLARARLAYFKSNLAEAMSYLDKALKNNAGFIEGLYMKAHLLFADGKSQEAIKLYQQIVKIDPRQINAHLALADLYLAADQIKEAQAATEAAEKISSNHPLTLYTRAVLNLRLGKIKEANDAILQVLKVAPKHLPSLLVSAQASYGLGQYEKSLKNAELVLAQNPGDIHAVRILAASHLKLNNAQAALDALAPSLQAQKKDAGLYALAGEAHLKQGNYLRAMDYLDRASSLSPESAFIKTQQANVLLVQGQTDAAVEKLKQASQLNDQAGQSDILLILLQLKKREFDQALQSIAMFEKKLPNNPVTQNLRAAAYLGNKDKTSARKTLEQALAIDPKFYPAAANLANLDIQEKRPEAARKRFEVLLENDKENIQAMLALADLARSGGQQEQMIKWLNTAATTQPTALKPRAALISHYLQTHDNATALAIAKDFLGDGNESLDAINLLGMTQLQVGDSNNAVATFIRLTEKANDSPDAYLQLGRAQLDNKQYTAARTSLSKALKLKPDHFPAQEALLQLALTEKRHEEALTIARQMQSVTASAAVGFDREGEIHMIQKRLPQAIKSYEKALSLGAGSATLIRLHRALLQTGDMRVAEQRLQTWLKTRPDDQNVRIYLAGQYLASKRYDDSSALYEEALRAVPDNVLVLNNLANIYQQRKDGRALGTAQKAYQLAPSSAIVQDTLGWILAELGQLDRALPLLRDAAGKAPKVASIRYHFAVVLARSGQRAEAKRELSATLSGGQRFPEEEQAVILLKSL